MIFVILRWGFLYIVWPSVLSFNNHLIHKKAAKNICIAEKVLIRLTFNPGWALTGFQTILPPIQSKNQHLVSGHFQNTLDLDERLLEPAIWSRDTGQRIPCFDRCQLIIKWMSNTKEVHSKPSLHVSLSTCYLEYGRHVAQLRRRRR